VVEQQWLDGQEATCSECHGDIHYEDGSWWHSRIDTMMHEAEPDLSQMVMMDVAEQKVRDLRWVYVVRTLWDDGSDQEDVFLKKDTAFKRAESFAATHLLSACGENDELWSEWSRTDGQMSVSVRMAKFIHK
jgi:hypothetical protein